MKVQKQNNKPLLNEDYKDQDLLTILDEGELKDTEYGTKTLLGLRFPNEAEKKMLLNSSSLNALIDVYGDDTAKWVGKQVRVHVVKQMVGKELKDVTYLTHPNRDMKGKEINA